MPQLLIINDDLQYCKSLSKILTQASYKVDYVCDQASALQYQNRSPADLIILEMPLADADTLPLISAICEHFVTPILLSSMPLNQQLILDGLEAGADQYLVKPYSNETLLACINALLRRVALEKQRLTFHHCSQQFSLKIARLPFTETETLLMQYLSKSDGTIVSKMTLQKEVLKKDLCLFDRNLDMHISNIRRKMKLGGLSKLHIRTVHGKGYLFSEQII